LVLELADLEERELGTLGSKEEKLVPAIQGAGWGYVGGDLQVVPVNLRSCIRLRYLDPEAPSKFY
jgi:hypothetical protein